jgi:hypothetical protein
MPLQINTIFALINDYEKANKLIKKAIDLAQEQEAFLEIIFVHEEALFSLPDFFRPKQSVDKEKFDVQKIKEELIQKVKDYSSKQAFFVSVKINDSLNHLEQRVKGHEKSLIVMSYHERLSHSIISKIKLPSLILKHGFKSYVNLAIPINVEHSPLACIDMAKTVFPQVNMKLLYDDVCTIGPISIDASYLELGVEETQKVELDAGEVFKALQKKTGLKGVLISEYSTVAGDIDDYIQKHEFQLSVLSASHEHIFEADSIIHALFESLKTDCFICRG